MSRATHPESIRGHAVLGQPHLAVSDGWMSGPELISEMGKVIPPGEAQRFALSRTHKDAVVDRSAAELIAAGRRSRVIRRINHFVDRGLWETDPPKLLRDHWAGHARWRIRSKFPGAILMPDAAERIGVAPGVLNEWIAKGLAPDGARLNENQPKSVRLVSPTLLELYEKIAELRPPHGGRQWKSDPRLLWQTPEEMHNRRPIRTQGPAPELAPAQGVTLTCPHCSEPILLSLQAVVEPGPAEGWLGPSLQDEAQELGEDDEDDGEGDGEDRTDPQDDELEADSRQDDPGQDDPGQDDPGEIRPLALRSGRILQPDVIRRIEATVREARLAGAQMNGSG